ncbi:stomatin-like protein 1 [Denticeps clupeoides]|uniref:Band 7 domain-containing protein n=1 Tax=Denticeps clupeoides TaxID=299321 RepID=A0AAY4DCW2_9TELE|nr:stomatin-like protein 1 [Denticeps clupeoides]
MFGKSFPYQYQSLPHKDPLYAIGPGLFVPDKDLEQNHYSHRGHSFDYVPKIIDEDFTDRNQGVLSRICHRIVVFLVTLCTFITFPISGWFVLKVVPNFQRIVYFRLGRVCSPKGPGVVLVLPFIDQWQRVDLRTRAFNIPPCKVSTNDGGVVSVGADIQFRIWSPVMSVVAVQDLNASTRLTAQNALTQCLSRRTVGEIQSDRVKLGDHLQIDINEMTRLWGLEVDRVELSLEGVLRGPDNLSPSGSVIMPPSVPGMEGLVGPIQQLAHFLGNMAANQPPKVSVVNEQLYETPSIRKLDSVEQIMSAVSRVLSDRLVRLVGAGYQFHISSHTDQIKSYYVDLSQGCGACGEGEPGPEDPDVTLCLSEEDLLDMFRGELQPFGAYASGRLRVQGDLNMAMKLEELIKALQAHR